MEGPRRPDDPPGPSGVAKHWEASPHAALRTLAENAGTPADLSEIVRTVGNLSFTVNPATSLRRAIASQQLACVASAALPGPSGRPLRFGVWCHPTSTPAPPSSVCCTCRTQPAAVEDWQLARCASCYVNLPYSLRLSAFYLLYLGSWNGVLYLYCKRATRPVCI